MILINFKEHRINYRIRIREVRVIDAEGKPVGVMQTRDAIKMAEEQGLDLVEVAPEANPPVCRILDYGKYKYEQQKKAKESKKHQKVIDIKEIKIRPNIEEHDYNVKLKSVQGFLEKGDKVKITLMFKGRESLHMDIGLKVLDRLINDTSNLAVIDHKPSREGRNIILTLLSKPKA